MGPYSAYWQAIDLGQLWVRKPTVRPDLNSVVVDPNATSTLIHLTKHQLQYFVICAKMRFVLVFCGVPMFRLVVCLLFCSPVIYAGDAPNVILVMADDMGWAQTGYYNHPVLKTPNLDDMARNGLRMDRFYAGSPQCSTTRATVLTGRTNDRTGVFTVGSSINKQEKMLSTAFRNAGYATGHFGKWHLNAVSTPEDTPMPLTDPHNPGELGFDYWLTKTNEINLDPLLSRNGVPERFSGDSSEVLVDEALKFIVRERAKGKPVFVVIWYSSPHREFAALEKDKEAFSELDAVNQDHHGELVAMDRSIGTLRKGLRSLGIADNTLLWFKSDNGGLPDFAVSPRHPAVIPDSTGYLRGSKSTIYEGGLRVPCVIEWPRHIAPRISRFPASTLDIFPTLIEVAHLDSNDINEVHDGISLLPVFTSEPKRRMQPIGFRSYGQYVWLDNDYKLIYVRKYTREQIVSLGIAAYENAPLVYELYNVSDDPSEQKNLLELKPKIAARMMAQLAAWNQSVDTSASGADYPEGRVLPSNRPEQTK